MPQKVGQLHRSSDVGFSLTPYHDASKPPVRQQMQQSGTHHLEAAVRMFLINVVNKINVCETELTAVWTSIGLMMYAGRLLTTSEIQLYHTQIHNYDTSGCM